ncbi:hypothetical protein PsorP6_000036 [Peronosclerospora sorghi]|uniref:Uncharacterized protein n=1 Tax=Peronosclerospora sorghi TaxID=230839 RepID=A0ACC0WUG7_9STRA|nr:hypothetical protein PsorP6_000036 [Peronosclerospora sorghi]
MSGKIVTPFKRGDLERAVRMGGNEEAIRQINVVVTSIRQAAEWGMGAVGKAFLRLLNTLPWNPDVRREYMNLIMFRRRLATLEDGVWSAGLSSPPTAGCTLGARQRDRLALLHGHGGGGGRGGDGRHSGIGGEGIRFVSGQAHDVANVLARVPAVASAVAGFDGIAFIALTAVVVVVVVATLHAVAVPLVLIIITFPLNAPVQVFGIPARFDISPQGPRSAFDRCQFLMRSSQLCRAPRQHLERAPAVVLLVHDVPLRLRVRQVILSGVKHKDLLLAREVGRGSCSTLKNATVLIDEL